MGEEQVEGVGVSICNPSISRNNTLNNKTQRSGDKGRASSIMPSSTMQSTHRIIRVGNRSVMPHKLLFPLLASGECVEDVRVCVWGEQL